MRWRGMLTLALLWLGFCAQPASAEGDIDINVTVPLGGLVKYESWIRLDVAVTSQGHPFSGYVELTKNHSRQKTRSSSLRQQVDLEKDKTVHLFFDMPAELLLNDWKLQLTQNGQVVQSEKIRLPYPKDGYVAGVMNDGENAFHFLAINQSQLQVTTPFTVQNLPPQMLPDQSWIYRNLDVLALGGKQVAQLGDKQVEAIKEWIKTGGIVILSAGPGQDDVINRFADIIDIGSGKGGSIDSQTALRSYIGEKQVPISQLEVYNSNLPLFVSKEVGRGMLLFVNYDVTTEPLASWQYNLQLWQNVLMKHGAFDHLEQNHYMDQMVRPLLGLSQNMPGVQTPAPIWMGLLWAVYVFLIAPLTYLLLKRWDKRQWAWGVIPGFAVLVTIGTFAIGKPLVVTANTSYAISEIQILDDKLAQTKTAATFLSVDKSQYDVEVQKQLVALPLSIGRNDYEPEGMMSENQLLSFRNVPYLTPKQAIGFGLLNDAGHIDASLSVHGDRLQGTVKNNTRFALDPAFVQIGLQRITIGPLKKGETKSVDSKLESLYMPRPQNRDGKETRQARLKQMQEAVLMYGQDNQVRIIGMNNEPLPLLRMLMPHEDYYWTVVTQSVRLQADSKGMITYPYGLLDVSIQEMTGDFDTKSPYLIELGKGSVVFELRTRESKADIRRLVVPLDHSSFRPFQAEVYQQKTGKWHKIDRGERLVLEKDLQDYLTPKGTILLRFTHDQKERLTLPTPFFQVEGSERTW